MIKKILIKTLSDKELLKKSSGEILNSETINYKSHKPEPNGLFCEKIFGPVKNYECYCGKYNKYIYKNIICDNCGVKITKNTIRRKNIGHVKLVIPIIHIWNFKLLPNKISNLLGISIKNVYKIIYYDKYIILNRGNLKKKYKKNKIIKESKYIYIIKKYKKKKFYINTGAEAIYYLLKNINIYKLYNKIKKLILNTSKNKKNLLLKRLKIIKMFKKGIIKGNKLTNLVFKILPVIPPDLRPIILLDNNKFASSDLNNFYKKIIFRNNRLKKLIKSKLFISNIIIINEKRLLQEAIDDLFDNTQNNKYFENKKLKSLSDILKGKYGRFRQNLLGKRVDYSARSVIVVNPTLKIHQCKIPIKIALELYKPFIIRDLLKILKTYNMKYINNIIKKKNNIVIFILKDIIKHHPLLLNRAPTLHRLSMLSFYPKLTNNKVIEIPPLVCSGFNADFDGDQMAIHLPLSKNSILETKLLTLSSQNILNISNGEPTLVPTQDMLLGLYYLTKKNIYNKKYLNTIFFNKLEVLLAYNNKIIKIHTNIKLKHNNKIIKTTTGRVIFNTKTPKNFKFINKTLNKNILKKIIKNIYLKNNTYITIKFLDSIKYIGFKYAYKGGLSFGLDNIKIPKEKNNIINKTLKKNKIIEINYKNRLISKKEKYNKIINIWNISTTLITNKIINNIKKKNKGYNSLYMMLDSGARGTKDQIKQIAGIKGLITKPNKNINDINVIKTPILSNFIEGLPVLEFFISTHGSRKGLADTALKTADAGYLTRRLVDSVHNVIINSYDCYTTNGIYIKKINKNIIGKFILQDVKFLNKNIIKYNSLITYKKYNLLKKYNINNILIRSILKCNLINGMCVKCYGINLSNNKIIKLGESVGVIAAQSIGEPGTQLTLKTFHVGGIIKNISKKFIYYSKYKGIIKYKNLKFINIKNNKYWVTSKNSYFIIKDNINNTIFFKKNILRGYIIYKLDNSSINIGDKIFYWNKNNYIIYSEYKGIIKYKEDKKKKNQNMIDSHYKKKISYLKINNNKNKTIKKYYLYKKNLLLVKNNQKINIGDPLINVLKSTIKFNDITGGLPKLSNLFEMKKKKEPSILANIKGKIIYGNIYNNYRYIYIVNNMGYKKKYKISLKKKILFKNKERINYGEKIIKGSINYNNLINIKGINYTQINFIKKLKNIYSTQGVNINNKHFEIIIRQMCNFIKVIKSGNTDLLMNNIVTNEKFYKKNKNIKKYRIIINSGDSKIYKKNNIINIISIKRENYFLKLKNRKCIKYIKCNPAIGEINIKGITNTSLKNNSFISVASFQETTKMLNKYSIKYKTDKLKGLKENVMLGNLIPSGTGFYEKKK